jgi:hypothetical protein
MVEPTKKHIEVAPEEHPHPNESKHTRVEGKRTKASTGPSITDGSKLGGEWKF